MGMVLHFSSAHEVSVVATSAINLCKNLWVENPNAEEDLAKHAMPKISTSSDPLRRCLVTMTSQQMFILDFDVSQLRAISLLDKNTKCNTRQDWVVSAEPIAKYTTDKEWHSFSRSHWRAAGWACLAWRINRIEKFLWFSFFVSHKEWLKTQMLNKLSNFNLVVTTVTNPNSWYVWFISSWSTIPVHDLPQSVRLSAGAVEA